MLQVHRSNDTRRLRVRIEGHDRARREWDKEKAAKLRAALERLEREGDTPPEHELTMWDF